MQSKGRTLGTIVLILAVIGYTIWNYMNGKTDFTMFLVCMALLCLPLFNIVRILISQWRDGE